MPNEICILCGKETTTDINTHIDFRTGYIEGAGQLCTECYLHDSPQSNSQDREMILIPKHYIKTYSNDFELGGKIRQYFHENYGANTTEPVNQWVCSYCGGDTSKIDSDYLVNADHLECVLKMNV